MYADFFGILTSVEDATDDRLERELESGLWKHLKWILSFLMKVCPGQSLCKWPAKSDHTRCGIQAEADA